MKIDNKARALYHSFEVGRHETMAPALVLHKLCQTCLVHITWMVCEMEGKWLFGSGASKTCSKQPATLL